VQSFLRELIRPLVPRFVGQNPDEFGLSFSVASGGDTLDNFQGGSMA
jgi:hypothetical protein